MDGYKDAKRLDSYVSRHFQMSAFTQMECIQGVMLNLPKTIQGSWIDTKARMASCALDITRDGYSPFTLFFSKDHDGKGSKVLVLEHIDVKQCPWPEPSTKFGHPASGPLVPMMQTPKLPLVLVRYSYMEGRPKEGSKFMEYLQSLIRKQMPKASETVVRNKLKFHVGAGIETEEIHLRTFARLLSHNASLLDPKFSAKFQSHWKGISEAVKGETMISFFVPCLRLRWRAMEEIEVGKPIEILGTTCPTCGVTADKLLCTACKSVYYCSKECSTAHWPEHKTSCRVSKRLITNPSSFPPNTYYISARTYVDCILETGFAIEQEAVKYSGTTNIGDAQRNEYGNERFIVRTFKDPNYSHNGSYKGQTMFLWDRRRSVLLRSSPGDPPMAKERGWPFEIPFHADGHQQYCRLLSSRGYRGQLIYLWARRVGDCLELDLKNIPDQDSIPWN
ncbi:hypothetical protein HGRIS_008797 [Hohenbuehelia grisea]|uniref:MYND-type domain-containing protein n=1 Tax=Hohenbuehelia grisea TaxID=104357 RepID=A0ABR3J9M2_9AGAR